MGRGNREGWTIPGLSELKCPCVHGHREREIHTENRLTYPEDNLRENTNSHIYTHLWIHARTHALLRERAQILSVRLVLAAEERNGDLRFQFRLGWL